MAERISFGDTLILKGEKLLIDNGASDGVIKSKNGTLKIDGNLTVSGTTTTVNSETVTIADNIIVLNSNETGSPSENGGIEIERGTSSNKSLTWNETDDKWTVGAETFVATTFEGNLTGDVTGNVTGTVSSIANHTTSDLTEGTNKYFTDARIDTHLNVSGATANQVLKWTGTDFAWVTSSSGFDGAFSSLTGKPTTLAGYGITDGGGSVTPSSTDTFTNKSGAISQWTNDANYLTSVPAQTFASLTSKPTTLAGYGITDGGGSSYSDTDVASYLNGNLDTHILPASNDAYDIGSASYKIRDLYLGDNSLHIGDNTLRTSGTNLLLNNKDIMDYSNVKNKPSHLEHEFTAGTNISITPTTTGSLTTSTQTVYEDGQLYPPVINITPPAGAISATLSQENNYGGTFTLDFANRTITMDPGATSGVGVGTNSGYAGYDIANTAGMQFKMKIDGSASYTITIANDGSNPPTMNSLFNQVTSTVSELSDSTNSSPSSLNFQVRNSDSNDPNFTNIHYSIEVEDITPGVLVKLGFLSSGTSKLATSLYYRPTMADAYKLAINYVVEETVETTTNVLSVPAIGIANLVEDTTPQLGGNLDLQTFDINSSATDFEINLGAGSNLTSIGIGGINETGLTGGGIGIQSSTNSGSDIVLLGDLDFTSGLTTGEFIGTMAFDNATGVSCLLGLSGFTENGSTYISTDILSDIPVIVGSNIGTSNEVYYALGTNTSKSIHMLDSSGNTIYAFPDADGTASQVLTTDGSGDLSWSTPTITLSTLKSVVAASSDFADFQSRIAAL